jgi:hypothetical protein
MTTTETIGKPEPAYQPPAIAQRRILDGLLTLASSDPGAPLVSAHFERPTTTGPGYESPAVARRGPVGAPLTVLTSSDPVGVTPPA